MTQPSNQRVDQRLGVVAIGRNEGERLRRCLRSLQSLLPRVVYVDSGSTDGSVEFARENGVEVVELDLSIPFTAARARNAGVQRLLDRHPDTSLVQFVDGDCELVEGWIERAFDALRRDDDVAVVCGRRREKYPDASLYNALIDLEWDTPVGEAEACGGDAVVRIDAFRAVGGFRDDLIAGEEPEMCYRIRRDGWRILRIDAEMTVHDAALTQFRQVWKRMLRTGHAAAEGSWLHGWKKPRHNVRRLRSPMFWALLLPVIALVLAWPTRGLSLAALLVVYGVQWIRLFIKARRRGCDGRLAAGQASITLLGKFGELAGAAKFLTGLLSRRPSRIIEYKDTPAGQRSEAEA